MARLETAFVAVMVLGLAPGASAEDDDLHTRMMRATVKISHDRSTATGFVLTTGQAKRPVLVTAGHVFDNTPSDYTTVVFRVRKAEGEYQKVPVRLRVREGGKPKWTRHPTEDVAVIKVTPPKDADLSAISLESLATDDRFRKRGVAPGQPLALLGYPHREEGSPAGFPLLREGPIASFPLLPAAKIKTFWISANVFEGDSGAPVYLAQSGPCEDAECEGPLIVGLVAGQRFIDEDMKMLYGTSKIRHRLGLAVIVHAQFIKEAIDRMK